VVSRHDPIGAKNELRDRILSKLAPYLSAAEVDDELIRFVVDQVMDLFPAVEDYWERIDITTLNESGESFIENRWLLTRVPVQGYHWTRPIDRSVP
jgi:hypothetical protein